MKKTFALVLFTAFSAATLLAQTGGSLPKPLLPLPLLIEIINEASGELALQNEVLLAGVKRALPSRGPTTTSAAARPFCRPSV